eukprot:8428427-Heterocapsa_arctica.AAC.1
MPRLSFCASLHCAGGFSDDFALPNSPNWPRGHRHGVLPLFLPASSLSPPFSPLLPSLPPPLAFDAGPSSMCLQDLRRVFAIIANRTTLYPPAAIRGGSSSSSSSGGGGSSSSSSSS